MLCRLSQSLGAVALLALPFSTPAFGQPALWEVKSSQSTVYLFGTVHLLPSDTDWRYPALDKALAASDSLTIELTDDDPAHMQALVTQYGLDPSHPLSAQLTAAENATLVKAAQTAGVPGGEQTLDMMRPWLAALTLEMAPLIKAGLDPAHGVDKLLQAKMIKAGKPVNGLETSEQQISFLANMPQPLQLDFLRDTLHDANKDSSLEKRRHQRHRPARRRRRAQGVTGSVQNADRRSQQGLGHKNRGAAAAPRHRVHRRWRRPSGRPGQRAGAAEIAGHHGRA